MIRFFVGGLPRSMQIGGVARFRKGDKIHMVPKRNNSTWAVLVGEMGRAHAPEKLLEGGVSFTAIFHLPRPSSTPRKVALPLKRPDLENLTNKLTRQVPRMR